ncbi:hypothetical protein H5410_025071 [Solanum commersonii]|uniref:Uncharacterized protein n=2 Tax=Solanum TaxID=4107 RepID=A0ABQ7UP17_SOLTU|nr:hypothetical protein H5410_025071 [Solanum commersonii]KAH0740300.1 hypothetical protein KY290_033343 [Solanum tuberosum]KAH0753590.1 hypothetical protein KY290_023860 [Solanum tuberosum]
MANCSSTLFMLLLLVVASGTMVLASKPKEPDTCMTYLGPCGSKDCDANCCRDNCLEQFKHRKPEPVCELIPGDATRLCNCYHWCP